MVAYRVLGKPTPRVEGAEKVTGNAKYTADQFLPGTIWGRVLHSPYAHARIVSIDTSAAKALPGVHAVITGADVEARLWGRIIKDVPVLATDRVRYIGDRVAAVAADDEDIAGQALDLIEVEYEELPAVFDPEEALSSGAPLLHPDYTSYVGVRAGDGGSNAYAYTKAERGDPDAGFAASDVVVENTYRLSRVHQIYLEPHSVLVDCEGERVQVWCSSKAPYNMRESLANAIGLPEEQVVINPVFIGGDFGGKGSNIDMPICYYLARFSGRPVRMVLDYIVDEFQSANPRHEVIVKLKTGVMRDGTLVAHHVHFLVNCGAYAGYKPRGSIGGAAQSAGPYRIPNTRIESVHAYTNTVPGGHMRAPGEPQAAFAIESQIDEVARAIGMDPVEFRLKNLVREGEETPGGHELHDPRAIETLHAAAEAAGYSAPKRQYAGRGVAVGERGPGGGQGNTTVVLRPDGTVVLQTPVLDQGTGTYTTLFQVVSEELGIPMERMEIDVESTDFAAFDSGLGGSRGTRVNTGSAQAAALDAKAKLLDLAAQRLDWQPDQLLMREGQVRNTALEESIGWDELLARFDTSVRGEGHVTDTARTHFTAFAAQIAEVEVDPETGEVTVLSFVSAHDVGKVLNPIMHQGQVNGGFMQGLGYALMEELKVEDGRVTSLSFGDYKVPTARDIPPLQTVLVETAVGSGPYAVKGIGETPISPVAPAIANAIEDAIGVRIRDLPITAEKVYRALKARQG